VFAACLLWHCLIVVSAGGCSTCWIWSVPRWTSANAIDYTTAGLDYQLITSISYRKHCHSSLEDRVLTPYKQHKITESVRFLWIVLTLVNFHIHAVCGNCSFISIFKKNSFFKLVFQNKFDLAAVSARVDRHTHFKVFIVAQRPGSHDYTIVEFIQRSLTLSGASIVGQLYQSTTTLMKCQNIPTFHIGCRDTNIIKSC